MAQPWQSAPILCAHVALCLLCYISVINSVNAYHLDVGRTRKYVEKKLEHSLKSDKGKGCLIRRSDPFSLEASKFDKKEPDVQCVTNIDWVKCYYSNCKVVNKILHSVRDIQCEFQDILYHSDASYTIGPATVLLGHESYELKLSDHIKVACRGTSLDRKYLRWSGNTLGFRNVVPREPPAGREFTFNVLIFAFDSMSRNGFVRLMPKSWKVLTKELGATVMEGYNIVGEATPAALIPILTGRTELELPDTRKSQVHSQKVDVYPFIFYKLLRDGYRTAYFEDMPNEGTFQFRLKGWNRQPVDHYLQAFFSEERKKKTQYCVGSTPIHILMMNITEQFMSLNGKRFVFTFIGELSHGDLNKVQTADKDFATFLRNIKVHSQDTLLVVMGDHGPRSGHNADRLKTLEGKFEERQPLMALRLPTALVRNQPEALAALQANARALTTPHDLHATLLHVLGMTQHWNRYRVPGADLPRALTMLEPIPNTRSCSEAGIERHWCACVTWQHVSRSDSMYQFTAETLLDFVNHKITHEGTLCVRRTLESIVWVRREQPNSQLLTYSGYADTDGYTSKFGAPTKITEDRYQAKIVVSPERDVIEASLTYIVSENEFLIDVNDVYTTNNSWVCPWGIQDIW